MSDCVAQGRLSVESVGRLVELERLASQKSPKPIFERALSWQDDDTPAIARSISDSLADAAFTMELGECDVEDHDEHSDHFARPRRASYPYSPYRYSFCAFSGDDATAASKGELRGDSTHVRPRKCKGSAGLSLEERANRPSLFRSAQGAGLALGDTVQSLDGQAVAANEGGSEVVHAQRSLAKMHCDTNQDRQNVVPKDPKASDTFFTPTNIEDGIDFGEDEHEHGPPNSTAVASTTPVNVRTDLSAYYKQRRRASSMRRSNSDTQLTCTAKR